MSERVAARRADLEWRSVDGEVIVLDLRSQRYLSLNKSGAQLWPLIVEGSTEARLAGALVERFGIAGPDAEHDVGALLVQLREADLLETDDAGSPTQD